MAATLKLTHTAIGAEVRRGTYDIRVDGQSAGSLEMNATIETVNAGHLSLISRPEAVTKVIEDAVAATS